jgi:hypothetical protein
MKHLWAQAAFGNGLILPFLNVHGVHPLGDSSFLHTSLNLQASIPRLVQYMHLACIYQGMRPLVCVLRHYTCMYVYIYIYIYIYIYTYIYIYLVHVYVRNVLRR